MKAKYRKGQRIIRERRLSNKILNRMIRRSRPHVPTYDDLGYCYMCD